MAHPFWGPMSPAAGSSNPNGSVPALYTPARMRITVDPATGSDSAAFVVVNETVLAPDGVTSIDYGDTYTLTAATINGAVDRIPTVVRHPVFLDLPTGTTTASDGGNALGPELDFSRFIITGEVTIIDKALGHLDAASGIYINGTQSETLAPTVANLFNATTIGRGTLVEPVDGHRGAIVEIVGGLGRGQWRRCLRNSATLLQVSDSWSPTPDGTSVFRVWRPDSNLDATINVSCGNNAGFGGILFAPDVILNGGGVTQFPLNITEGGLVVCAALLSDGGTGGRSLTMVGGTFGTAWLDLARDPFFQRIVGPFFGSGNVDLSFRAAWFGAQCTTVCEGAVILASYNCTVDIRPDADGGGGAGVFLTYDMSKGQIRRPGNTAVGRVTGYGTGLVVIRNAHVRQSSGTFDISASSSEGVHVAGGAELVTSGIVSSTPGTTVGAIVREGGRLAGANACTISGATGELFLGNATSGTLMTWASIPANDAVGEPNECSSVRYLASP